ncbi:hypothetical protein L484_002877 [Morus notabilis]|uniref:Uncharacterized protein n=1 Tax=Morus notabilis TaxID=981085 RepID=W9RYV7_9ROSA|nr:hypothetical protein L484_002877 [Morus notabilis]
MNGALDWPSSDVEDLRRKLPVTRTLFPWHNTMQFSLTRDISKELGIGNTFGVQSWTWQQDGGLVIRPNSQRPARDGKMRASSCCGRSNSGLEGRFNVRTIAAAPPKSLSSAKPLNSTFLHDHWISTSCRHDPNLSSQARAAVISVVPPVATERLMKCRQRN